MPCWRRRNIFHYGRPAWPARCAAPATAGWLADTPHGAMPVRFSPLNDYGVLDHWLSPPGQAEVYIPLRLLARDDGCELVLTLFRPPGVDDARFEADAAWVARDLAAAKAWLESQPAS